MEIAHPADAAHSDDALDADLREVDAAIELVARGAAVRVELVGLSGAVRVGPIGLAHAQGACVGFRVERNGPSTRITIGPSQRR
jgi:hypothetical protein